MNLPKMILFDYGQTLVNERKFDGIKGTEAVLQYAIQNKYNRTPKEVMDAAKSINQEVGRFDPLRRHLMTVEVPNHMFTSYLYESQGIELSLSSNEIDKVFWEAAAPGVPTDGILEFLSFIKRKGIRSGVISNISYCQEALIERISRTIPDHEFEFILATSQYMFRKPNKRIFELALLKADLSPDEVWFIGDQYECDIVGATNAGMYPVWYIGAIDLEYSEKENILTIKHWDELKEIILKLEACNS